MNSATLKRNPEVLPESIMERPSARSIVVVEKLLTDSALATVATRLLAEHGPSFIAFLLEAVRLQELEAETLETAFKARFLASTNTWESLRGDMIEGIVEAANRRAKEDSEFKRNLEADSVEMSGGSPPRSRSSASWGPLMPSRTDRLRYRRRVGLGGRTSALGPGRVG
jgi:hypothetical protein